MSNDTCLIKDCGKRVQARGWCSMHYKRWSKYGDPLEGVAQKHVYASVEDRFFAKVAPPDNDGCTLWNASVNNHGYGTFLFGRKVQKSHRVAYVLEFGEIPDNLDIDHTCHTRDTSCPGGVTCKHRKCVNPLHLEPVTKRENYRRGRSPAKANADKTHCKHGHAFTADNIYGASQGRRICKACTHRRNKNRAT
jgi:hypothetical protein